MNKLSKSFNTTSMIGPTDPINERMLTAASTRSLSSNETLRTEVKKDTINLNATNFDGKTALMCTAAIGNAEGMQILIDAGADINFINASNQNALTLAANYGADDCVEILIKLKADCTLLDEQQKQHYAPIFQAILRKEQQEQQHEIKLSLQRKTADAVQNLKCSPIKMKRRKH